MKAHVYSSLAKIEVFIRTKSKEVFEEVPNYSGFGDLTKELGAALSFYMGLSFIMLFELLELGVDLVLAGWAHIRPYKSKK